MTDGTLSSGGSEYQSRCETYTRHSSNSSAGLLLSVCVLNIQFTSKYGKTRPQYPGVARDCFVKVLMLIHEEQLDILTRRDT